MSTKIENVVYRAFYRDEISADFSLASFSTATPGFDSYPTQYDRRADYGTIPGIAALANHHRV
jgi:hypothetical protein